MDKKYFSWSIYVLDTNIDDLVYKCDFVGTLDEFNKKLNELYNSFNEFSYINIKILMK